MYFVFKEKKGFTIIELIITIFILSIAIVGIFSAFSIVTILTSDASDRLTGTYLAQEGVEIIRNIRDTNWLNINDGVSGIVWNSWLDGCTTGCEADYRTTGTAPTGWSGTGRYLQQNYNNFYLYSVGFSNTKFKRKITITCLPDANCSTDNIMKVKVQVSWDEKGNILYPLRQAKDCNDTNCITVETTLYNWYITSH